MATSWVVFGYLFAYGTLAAYTAWLILRLVRSGRGVRRR